MNKGECFMLRYKNTWSKESFCRKIVKHKFPFFIALLPIRSVVKCFRWTRLLLDATLRQINFYLFPILLDEWKKILSSQMHISRSWDRFLTLYRNTAVRQSVRSPIILENSYFFLSEHCCMLYYGSSCVILSRAGNYTVTWKAQLLGDTTLADDDSDVISHPNE